MAYLACLLLLSWINHTTQIEGLDVNGIDTRRAANRKDAGAAKRESSAVATFFLKLEQFRHEPGIYPVACHRPPFWKGKLIGLKGPVIIVLPAWANGVVATAFLHTRPKRQAFCIALRLAVVS